MLVYVHGAKCVGIQAVPVTVEVDITLGIGIHLVGLADAAVKESLLRTVTARPTRWIPIPRVISTSTVTGTASIPTHFAPCTYTSIFRFCPNLRKSSGSEGKKRKYVAKCFGLFQRKVHKKGLPGVWEADLKGHETD